MSNNKFRTLSEPQSGVLVPTNQLPASALSLLPEQPVILSPLARQLQERREQEPDVIAEVNLRLVKDGDGVKLAIADSGISEEEALTVIKYAGDAYFARIQARTQKPN